jgi:hypothetical protein
MAKKEPAVLDLDQLACEIEARVLQPGRGGEIRQVYAGDRMSDLLEHASPETLLVTNLANAHLARLAALMDVPALCLAGGAEPPPELLETAAEAGTAVLVSPADAASILARGREWLQRQGANRR